MSELIGFGMLSLQSSHRLKSTIKYVIALWGGRGPGKTSRLPSPRRGKPDTWRKGCRARWHSFARWQDRARRGYLLRKPM